MSTTRSQLYRFARDLGDIEAVEHGYKRGGMSGGMKGLVERQVRRTGRTRAEGPRPSGRTALVGGTTSCASSSQEAAMPDTEIVVTKKSRARGGGAGGIWFLGFLGALVYYIHTHSGTVWLVLVAILKAIVWPAFLVYHLLQLRI